MIKQPDSYITQIESPNSSPVGLASKLGAKLAEQAGQTSNKHQPLSAQTLAQLKAIAREIDPDNPTLLLQGQLLAQADSMTSDAQENAQETAQAAKDKTEREQAEKDAKDKKEKADANDKNDQQASQQPESSPQSDDANGDTTAVGEAGGVKAETAEDAQAEGADVGEIGGAGSSSGSAWSWALPLGLIGGAGLIAASSSSSSSSNPTPTPPVDGDAVAQPGDDPAGDPTDDTTDDTTDEPVDTTPPAAAVIGLLQDTGASGADGLTSNGQINVALVDDVASWRYSLDSGKTWVTGTGTDTGTGFILPEGSYESGSVVVEVSDAAGNTATSSLNQALTVDTTAPNVLSMDVDTTTNQITLTLDSVMDGDSLPGLDTLSVQINGSAATPDSVTVNDQIITINMPSIPAGASVQLGYTDPTDNDDTLAVQDLAGNDLASFSQGVVIDGYVRGAQLYADRNRDGQAQDDEALDIQTDATGRFFAPSGVDAPLLAIGGINTDTGLVNSVILTAPVGATLLNPLTTLTQQVIEKASQQGQSLTPTEAAALVVDRLGLELPTGRTLLDYDPVAATESEDATEQANAVATQKVALQLASIATFAEQAQANNSVQVFDNTALEILTAQEQNTLVNLADSQTIANILADTGTNENQANAAVAASQAIDTTTDLAQASAAQAQALDAVAPSAPSLALVTSAITNQSEVVVVRVTLDVTSLTGQAVVAGDTLQLLATGTSVTSSVTSATITAQDIAAGYIDVTIPERGDGSQPSDLPEGDLLLQAIIRDRAGNESQATESVSLTVDITPPEAATITTLSEDTGLTGDRLTNDNTPRLSIAGEANALVSLYRLQGDTDASAVAVAIDSDAYQVSTSDDGYELLALTALEDGTYVVGLTDEAGNETLIDDAQAAQAARESGAAFTIDTLGAQGAWYQQETTATSTTVAIEFTESMLASPGLSQEQLIAAQSPGVVLTDAKFIDGEIAEDVSPFLLGTEGTSDVFFNVTEGDIVLANIADSTNPDHVIYNASAEDVTVSQATPAQVEAIATIADLSTDALAGLLAVQPKENATGTAFLLVDQDKLLFIDDQVIASFIDNETGQVIDTDWLLQAHTGESFENLQAQANVDLSSGLTEGFSVELSGNTLTDVAGNVFDQSLSMMPA